MDQQGRIMNANMVDKFAQRGLMSYVLSCVQSIVTIVMLYMQLQKYHKQYVQHLPFIFLESKYARLFVPRAQ